MPAKEDEKYTIPDGIVEISYYAFHNNTHVKEISIPGSVTLIEPRGLGKLSNLQVVNYYGKNAPDCNVYGMMDTPTSVIINVPSNYNGTTFCTRTVTNKNLPSV